MKLDESTKEDAIFHLEKAIFVLDGIVDNKLINIVAKLKNILIFIKRYL